MLESAARAGEATCLSDPDMTLADVVSAAADGLDGKGATVAPTTTTTVPVDLDTSGDESATAPSSTGTFTDTGNGLTLERSASSTSAATTTANWEYMSVTYDLGPGSVTDTVFKVAGSSTVGVLTRNSNTSVTINLASSVPFTLTIKYNGKSVGTTYVFPAV